MRKRFIFLVIVMIVATACSQVKTVNSENPVSNDHLVLVEGGTFTSTKTNDYEETITIDDFYIGKYEVTQKEWMDVMGSNPSHFKGDDLPVEMVSWYDAIEYCNKRSIKEGLEPYYNINKNELDPNNKSEYDHIKWTVTINEGANGYRLPTEVEWEYAASGGQLSESYTYSGSHNVDEVAWYWRNAGDQYLSGDWSWPTIENNNNQTNSVGLKEPNELGLFDMSGNVREWCWDWYGELGGDNESGSLRVVKGGGWLGDVSSNEISFRGKFEASGIGPDQGFRVARNK
ncbi:formylglycine-generating enzyme family protein [Halalkalibacterium halodurans]|jgi:formylglycine-generating enzyme required for sulfatase activity|uniref:Transcriptional regulator n=1 Tax=Halalkalibacterium halodurans TaxID=86665 RepID=A0A0M0KC59_ALKHA|nr:formylglycine-generating enzyme family protein [Halalkalibacterium halodurans]TPE70350.1 formylglycine-generating enzyme family protein [Halalkalibacterium halodurans]